MFENLKKKFSSFIESVTKKEEEKEEWKEGSVQAEPQKQELQKAHAQEVPAAQEQKSWGPDQKLRDQAEEKKYQEAKTTFDNLCLSKAVEEYSNRHLEKPVDAEERIRERQEAIKKSEKAERIPKDKDEIVPHTPIPANLATKEVKEYFEDNKAEPKRSEPQITAHNEPKVQPKISFATRLKGAIFHDVEIKDKDVTDLLEEFKMALLQSDVNYEVAEKVVNDMHKRLVGSKVGSKNISSEITGIVRGSMMSLLVKNSNIDLLAEAKKRKESGNTPFKILFIGPNGAGKTTTIGKIANMFLENGLSCALSASDTFRAAAIEQTSYHAQKLGINVIKGEYGADPASIAFDAVAFAKARGIDVVLIDSAGRQETNRNLIEEIKKMVRVAKPDLKIFVGEAITGNSLISQVKVFDEAVKIDGIILTKLDVDAKGGNTISILSETTIPVLFFGTGEAYSKLIPYDPKIIIDSIVPEQNN